MAQVAYLRWPNRAELLSLLPGGEPTLYGVPPFSAIDWDPATNAFPLLRVDPDVPPGTRYVFPFAELFPGLLIPPQHFDRHYARWLRRLTPFLRRIVLFLEVVPVAWTAPQPEVQPSRRLAMTSPAPAPLPITGGVRVVHKGTISGQQVFMTHGVKMTGAPTVAHLQALADAARSSFDTHITVLLPSGFVRSETVVQDLSPLSAASAAATSTGIGGNGAITETLSVAAIVQWRTARAGRSYRGRTFHAPLIGGAVAADGRTIVAANLNAILLAWQAYRNAINALTTTNGGKVAVLSTRRGTAEECTAVTVASVVGSQRGRLR